MKKTVRMLCLALALLLAALPVFAETATGGETAPEDPLLVTVGGTEVRLSEIVEYANYMYYQGYLQSADDYTTALDNYLLSALLPKLKVNELGAEALLGEDYQAAQDAAKAEFESYVQEYAAQLIGDQELTDEEKAQKYAESLAYYAEMGYDEARYVRESLEYGAFSALLAACEFTPSEEDVQAACDDYIAMCADAVGDDAATYEIYTKNYGYEIPYMPAGYRGVTHILLKPEEALLTAYTGAADDEAKAEAARQMVAAVQPTIDEIYAKLTAGESFESLIALYGADPGMAGDNLVNGYAVHAKSVIYDAAFTSGAFSEKMQSVGDVSDPVPSGFGVHILYYLRDVPAGAQSVSEGLRESMKENAALKLQEAQMRAWLAEYPAEYADAYAEYIG